jgi:hypothetical protein
MIISAGRAPRAVCLSMRILPAVRLSMKALCAILTSVRVVPAACLSLLLPVATAPRAVSAMAPALLPAAPASAPLGAGAPGAPPAPRADELADLAATLVRFLATDEIQGSLELLVSRQSTEEHWTDQSRATVEVEDGPQGVRVMLSRGGSRLALQELRAQTLDPAKHTPTYNALQVLSLNEVSGDLDCAAALAQDVSLAHLVSARPSTYLGKPARLLVLARPSRLSQEALKHVRTAETRLSIWLGADGMPLGAEKIEHTKGRFLVLFFENVRKQTWTFARKGNRLYATRHEVSDDASGLGQEFRNSTVAILTLH